MSWADILKKEPKISADEIMNKYNNLNKTVKDYLMVAIEDTYNVLRIYKYMSKIHPKWDVNRNDLSSQYNDIRNFMATRIIQNRFEEIPKFKRDIDYSFQRAIWHLTSIINFSEKNNESIILSHIFDIYCSLSRNKTVDELSIEKKQCPLQKYIKLNEKSPLIIHQVEPLIVHKLLCDYFLKNTYKTIMLSELNLSVDKMSKNIVRK